MEDEFGERGQEEDYGCCWVDGLIAGGVFLYGLGGGVAPGQEEDCCWRWGW